MGYAAALLIVTAAILVLEMSYPANHGTHLMVGLTLVLGATLLLGAGPAATALAGGAGLAVAVSALRADTVLESPLGYFQLLAYLVMGVVFILVTPAVRRARRPADRPVLSTPAPDVPLLVEPLTARELETLRLAATGISVDEIAGRLFVSSNTVKTHLTHIYAKLGVRGRTDAVRAAIHCGCLTTADICPHLAASATGGSPVTVTHDHPNR